MVRLFCAIVGKRTIVSLDIGDEESVGDLKDFIQELAGLDHASQNLGLYLTKRDGRQDRAWMTTADPDYAELSRGDERVKATYLTSGMLLDPTWPIEDYFDGAPSRKVIHVLVERSDDRSTTSNLRGAAEGTPSITNQATNGAEAIGGMTAAKDFAIGQSGKPSSLQTQGWQRWPFSYLSELAHAREAANLETKKDV